MHMTLNAIQTLECQAQTAAVRKYIPLFTIFNWHIPTSYSCLFYALMKTDEFDHLPVSCENLVEVYSQDPDIQKTIGLSLEFDETQTIKTLKEVITHDYIMEHKRLQEQTQINSPQTEDQVDHSNQNYGLMIAVKESDWSNMPECELLKIQSRLKNLGVVFNLIYRIEPTERKTHVLYKELDRSQEALNNFLETDDCISHVPYIVIEINNIDQSISPNCEFFENFQELIDRLRDPMKVKNQNHNSTRSSWFSCKRYYE